MMLEELVLSDVPLRFAQALLSRENPSGSFLLVGPKGVGKATLAKALVRKLHETEGFDPDLLILEGEESIGINEVKELNYFLSLKPVNHSPKAVLILDAERLTLEAANALLKTLEESQNALLILTAVSPELLPPTIVSRCLVVRFGLIESSRLSRFLGGEGKEESHHLNITALLAGGRVGRALRIARDHNFLLENQSSLEEIREFLRCPLSAKLSFLERGWKSAELKQKLNCWLEATCLLIELKLLPSPPSFLSAFEELSLSELIRFASLLDQALFYLRCNQNANLVLGEMILSLDR